MAKEYTYQCEVIEYESGVSARNYRKEFILNSGYERCIGVAVIPVSDGGNDAFLIGLEDKDKTIISNVPSDFLASDKSAGLNPSNRLLPVNIKAGGHKVKLVTEITEDTTAILSYYVVFQLEREVIE